MKYMLLSIAGAALAATTAPAQVQEPAPAYKVTPDVQVLERNSRGHATRVMVGAEQYPVCMTEQQDRCIQPRAAGLGFGERPLGYWPNRARAN